MFSISATGGLTPVPGSLFPDPGARGIDCNCASTQLYTAINNASTSKVDVFNIGLSGVLSRIPFAPFTGPGLNTNVAVLSPNDNQLFVSSQGRNAITEFSVAFDGSLTERTGSSAKGALFPVGMATNEAGTLLYAADFDNLISGFTVGARGDLTPVDGSPFSNGFPGEAGLISLAVFPAKNCCSAPVISGASASSNILWPPDHKFEDVTIHYSVTDHCPNTCVLTVSSNEPVNGTGDGSTSSDWQVIDAHHLRLRAERSGNGNGRIYSITITCTNDIDKRSSTKTVTVTVPHDQGNGK
jgi:hypothetical protein